MSVAIHGGLGNPPITDATAVPGDLAEGKIAYNNSGKIEGTNIHANVFHNTIITTFNIPKNTYFGTDNTPNDNPDKDMQLIGYDCYNNTFGGGLYDTNATYFSGSYILDVPELIDTRLVGIEINGNRVLFGTDTVYRGVIFKFIGTQDQYATDHLKVQIGQGKIYFGSDSPYYGVTTKYEFNNAKFFSVKE